MPHLLPSVHALPLPAARPAFPRLRRALLCLAVFLSLGCLARAGYVTNGGFENGLTGWTAAPNSGTATFTVTTNDARFDANCLQVVVNDAGSSSNYPRLTYATSYLATSANTYTLSFFAKCPNSTLDNRPSKLRIHLDGGSTYTCDYQPCNKWEEFHFSFIPALGTMRFSITFESPGTYELDRILLVDQNEPIVGGQSVIDTPTSYLWQWGQQAFNQTSRYPISGTDNDIAQQLPDGRVAWIFNDSDLAPLDYTTNYRGNDTGFVNNAIVVQNGGTLTPLKVNSSVFVPLDGSHLFWPLSAAIENGKLKTMLSEIDPGQDFKTVGYWLATHNLPDLTEASPFFVGVPWGGQMLDGFDGYFYIYNDSLSNQRMVARTPAGSLSDGSKWTFWNGSTWIADKSQAAVLSNFSNAYVATASVERLGTNNFVAVSYAFVGSSIGVHFAPTPVGPWTDYANIYTTPVEEEIYYDTHIYKHLGQNGTYTIGYSDYRFGGDNKVLDRDYYFPQFIKTPNLLAMSPYTSGTFRDDFPTQNFTNWQTYGGNWAEGFGLFVVDATAAANNGARAIAKGVVLSDFVYDANVRNNTANGSLGMVVRASAQGTGVNAYKGYYVALQPGTGVTLSRVNGSASTVIGSASLNVAANTFYRMKVSGVGSTLKVYVTDMVTPIITVTDSTYPSGGFGLRSANATGYFDDVVITDQRYEAESLSVAASSGAATTSFYDPGLASAGAGVTYAAAAVGDYVTYRLPQVSPGNYTLSVRVKKNDAGGSYLVSMGPSATATSQVGGPVVTYASPAVYSEVNLGRVQVSTQADQFVKFTTSGRIFFSGGFGLTLDSIKLTPLATPYTAWQGTYFTPAEQVNGAVSGDNADPDGDGIPNLLEYALNLNPRVASTQGLPAIGSVLAGGSQYLTLSYQQVLGATDIVYTPQVSGDLANWSSGVGNVVAVSATANPDGTTQTVVVRDATPMSGATARFMRLMVTRP